MNEPIQHFVLVFDQSLDRLVRVEEFGEDGEAALASYTSIETHYADRKDVEVVLLGSDSLETVKLTHANYFDGLATVSKYLAGIRDQQFHDPRQVVFGPRRRRVGMPSWG